MGYMITRKIVDAGGTILMTVSAPTSEQATRMLDAAELEAKRPSYRAAIEQNMQWIEFLNSLQRA